LTDGEVSDTQAVVDLIKQNSNRANVHTFGIGNGVSTELIKNCAFAGRGHFCFIDNPAEIESKVMEAL